MANGQPRPAFYVAVFLVILGLVGLAIWRYGAAGPGGGGGQFSSEEDGRADVDLALLAQMIELAQRLVGLAGLVELHNDHVVVHRALLSRDRRLLTPR